MKASEDTVQARAAIPLLAFLLVGAWGILLWSGNRGFGFIDEGYYLIAIANPARFSNTVSDFGPIWHPLFRLVGGDVPSLRLGGAAVLETVAVVFGWSLARFLAPHIKMPGLAPVVILTAAVSIWWEYGWWRLSTPNYNQLNLCGLLLIFTGALEAVSRSRHTRSHWTDIALPSLAAGAGLVLSALNKQPSAAAGALLAIAWLFAMPVRRPWWLLLTSALCASGLLLATIIAIHGSVETYADSLRAGLTITSQLNPHGALGGILGAFAFPMDGDKPLRLAAALLLLCAAPAAGWFWTRLAMGDIALGARGSNVAISTIILFGGVWMAWARGSLAWPNHVSLHALQFAFLTLAIGMAARLSHIQANGFWRQETSRAALLLLLVPVAYSLGTLGWIYYNLPGAAIFWASALLILSAMAANTRLLVATALLCGATTLGFLVGFVCRPLVNGPPMWRQDQPIILGVGHSVLLVDADTRDYIIQLSRAASRNGFKVQDPLFDFSRAGPGASFALDAIAPGTPYVGYGDLPFQSAVLASVPRAQGRNAWILADARDSNAIFHLPWQLFGRQFPQDYEPVAQIEQRDFGAVNVLWKPRVP